MTAPILEAPVHKVDVVAIFLLLHLAVTQGLGQHLPWILPIKNLMGLNSLHSYWMLQICNRKKYIQYHSKITKLGY